MQSVTPAVETEVPGPFSSSGGTSSGFKVTGIHKVTPVLHVLHNFPKNVEKYGMQQIYRHPRSLLKGWNWESAILEWIPSHSPASVFIPPLPSTLHCPAAAVVRGWWGGRSTLHLFSIINSSSPALNEANQSRTPESKGEKKEMRELWNKRLSSATPGKAAQHHLWFQLAARAHLLSFLDWHIRCCSASSKLLKSTMTLSSLIDVRRNNLLPRNVFFLFNLHVPVNFQPRWDCRKLERHQASCDPCYLSFFLRWSYVVEDHLIPDPTSALSKKSMIPSLHPLLSFCCYFPLWHKVSRVERSPGRGKGTKGRRSSIFKLQRLLTHMVFCTAEKNGTFLKNL